MKYFGTQTNYLLDKSKPYQRPELRHAGPKDVNREAELRAPSRVACSDLLDHVLLISLIFLWKSSVMPGDEPTGKSGNNNNRNDSNQASIVCSEQRQSRYCSDDKVGGLSTQTTRTIAPARMTSARLIELSLQPCLRRCHAGQVV